MEKLKNFYLKKLKFKPYLISSLFFCICADILQIVYAKYVWLSPQAFRHIFMRLLVSGGINPSTLAQSDIAEGSGLIYITIWGLLYGFVLINSIFYFFFYKQKNWGISYTKFMVLTSLIITLFSFFSELTKLDIWSLFNLAQILIYSYVGLGFLFFKDLKTQE